MSIYYSGTFTRSSGVSSAITKQLKVLSLKPVKRIQVQFDPFHPKATTARDLAFSLTSSKVTNTNLNCIIKTNIVCDRSEPFIKVDLLENNRSIRFLAGNLTVLEILQLFNKHISAKVEAEPETPSLITKVEKKKAKKK
ncbi:39S ribosomal protein L53, mitochondrial [Agrilus planipennis]|uniref:Large ribosomal subunit protein mL53 n=1 Tax=Agrilus planipennis TaxID=224129 RepID=A0A1W4X276_AGRPL|nr:39S ribosomal protein L53, mitochondrial [Agrilus planipennis]